MLFEGSAHPASPTIRAGTPATVLHGGTSSRTTDPAAMPDVERPVTRLRRLGA